MQRHIFIVPTGLVQDQNQKKREKKTPENKIHEKTTSQFPAFVRITNRKLFRMKRNEKKPLGCGICPYKTNSACHLDRHLRIHTGQKPYACDMCSYRATDGGLLKRHKRVHSGEKPFICHICGHKTAQSCSLKDHMAVHTGKKRYSCDLCSFQCSRIGRLRDHQRIHKVKIEFKEGISRDGDILPKTEPGESKNDSDHVLHRCPHCNLEFSEVQYLDRHVTSVHSVGLTEPKQERQDSPTNEAPQPSNFCSLCASPHESSEALEIHIALHVVY
ncbi:hypothetical protein GE061_015809 [Apolygus lucorum]|uniref:C2H2-type domain-containing protein n=1 Tax=Apolygus lucorum TaxID=248454 RepID=A0A8S9XM87_APOLU|nr:hypothetical protein GE061_015809 [Apolygus lucorum]